MNELINRNVEKLLEPLNLAVKKVRAIEHKNSGKLELESAERIFFYLNKRIETAEKDMFNESDSFSAMFKGYGLDMYADEPQEIKLGMIGPFKSVKEFVDEYVDLMLTDREAIRMDINLNLNGDSFTLTVNDDELKEEFYNDDDED